jgi:transcriptional regulator with XRE-family HTH domain
MIKNKKQYKRTKELMLQFKGALDDLESRADAIEDKEDYEYTYNSYQYQYSQLEEEAVEYENIQSHRTKVLVDKSIDNLHEVLIQARIARNWTQTDLAKELELSPQQIQRYEATNYEGVSFWKVLDILDALELKIELKDIALPNPNYIQPEAKIIAIQSKQEEVRQLGFLFAVGE